MVFSTIIFLCVFLPVVILGYYLVPKQGKNLFLLICSLFFYAWGEPIYVLVMLASIIYNYLFGLAIANHEKAKPYLVIAVLVNLGVLCVFKYSGFLVKNIDRIIPNLLKVPDIALPIGISFYTFQGLSYCIDVYRDKKLVQKNPVNLALYIAMFPQLIAGPIVRYSDIKIELTERKHNSDLFAIGAERFIIGLAKKAILANTVGALATNIMSKDMQYMSMPVAWIGAIAYALQIYFDFSGYSDMAIGLGKIFGFHFAENFQYPYISKSIREFWRRWHISLSSWFRDYLYIPLGGSRSGNVYLNLLIVFVATGIWHGAAWGFLLWGLWHGLFIVLERIIMQHKKKNVELSSIGKIVSQTIGRVYTLFVVLVGWVLFALVDVRKTAKYLMIMMGIKRNAFIAYNVSYFFDKKTLFIFVIALLACIPWKSILKKSETGNMFLLMVIKRVVLLALLALSFVFIITGSYNPFIYFRF